MNSLLSIFFLIVISPRFVLAAHGISFLLACHIRPCFPGAIVAHGFDTDMRMVLVIESEEYPCPSLLHAMIDSPTLL